MLTVGPGTQQAPTYYCTIVVVREFGPEALGHWHHILCLSESSRNTLQTTLGSAASQVIDRGLLSG